LSELESWLRLPAFLDAQAVDRAFDLGQRVDALD
jgi:hypothetical protein